MRKVFLTILFISVLAGPLYAAGEKVPEKYKALFERYKTGLEKYITYLDRNSDGKENVVCFGAELLAANSNRGESLLEPHVLKGIETTLDRLKELGLQGVTVAIGYPVLSDEIRRANEYIDFYKKVADIVRKRDMKLCVKLHVVFGGTVFSSLHPDFSNLTIEKFEKGKRLMAERAINELSPDYLTLGGEPDTEAKLTRLRQLNNPATYAGMARYILKDLKKGKTLVGVGQGTWSTADFAKNYAQTDVDFINIHVYPFGKRVLLILGQICAIAKQYNKRLILDECWLYKASSGDGLSLADSANVYRKDYYNFWEPDDKLFLEAMAKVASQNNIEYVSPFWSQCFFSYLDYDPSDEQLSFAEANRKFIRAVSENMRSGQFSGTGRFYSNLIKKYGRNK
jgi:hypothetical protein